jgi:heme/copper-type cytochrome/quinol oxidase subunit 3
VCEFWLVLLATHVVWPQAGGQGHLDIMEWYWKLFLPIALAISVVCLTMAAVQSENFWNGKTILWFVLAISLALGMSMVTYYYHLHENDNVEETVTDDTASRSSFLKSFARPVIG